jgi:hypothetical protein
MHQSKSLIFSRIVFSRAVDGKSSKWSTRPSSLGQLGSVPAYDSQSEMLLGPNTWSPNTLKSLPRLSALLPASGSHLSTNHECRWCMTDGIAGSHNRAKLARLSVTNVFDLEQDAAVNNLEICGTSSSCGNDQPN